jgi:catechol 2,3-dioxygenase-like lactoylglutathione lyase family enzyme
MVFRALTPQLSVADVARAERWYRELLGLEPGFAHESFAAVRSAGAQIYLCRSPTLAPPPPATCCVTVDDADRCHALYRERGARIVEPIATKPWGIREFTLVDPDGHRFRIGHPTR